MNNLMVFNNVEFGEVRTVEVEGKIYFVAKDVAVALGYSNPQKAIRDHCKGVNETLLPTKGGKQSVKIIQEGDIYRLIVRSKLESAEKFERWVFDEVLPSIRQNGGYIMTDENMSDEEIMARALLVAQATIEKKNKELEEKEKQIQVLEPKANAYEEFLDRDGLIDVESFSKCLGIEKLGRNNMYKWLRDSKILMSNNIPYQQFINQKFFVIKPNGYHKVHGEIIEDFKSMITKKGIDYLLKRLKKDGYIQI